MNWLETIGFVHIVFYCLVGAYFCFSTQVRAAIKHLFSKDEKPDLISQQYIKIHGN